MLGTSPSMTVWGGAAAMKIATWNVNSVKARLPLLTRWLDMAKPDVALLQ